MGIRGKVVDFAPTLTLISFLAMHYSARVTKTVSSWDCAIEEIQVESQHFQMCSGLPVAKKLPQSGKNIGEDKGKVGKCLSS